MDHLISLADERIHGLGKVVYTTKRMPYSQNSIALDIYLLLYPVTLQLLY